MKTLIAYATRQGSTRRSAELLAATLAESGMEATVLDAARVGRAELAAHNAFVVGSSIMAGRWKGSATRLLRSLAGSGKPVAVFVSAAGMLTGKEPGSTLEERVAGAVAKYLDPVAAKAGITPAAKTAFGGRMVMFGKEIINNWDPEPIRAWAGVLRQALR